ncbi:MAG: metallophosphoesterase [Paludibacter sp.]|nr:metallophosphoesterase [Paludibacter sp.]
MKRKGKENSYYPVVRVLISLSIIMTMLAGAYITPRRFELTKTEIAIAGLPREFDGLRIIQISDLHLGSWNNKYSKLVPIINIVNAQNADILVFTGDMVNNYAEEADGWQPYFLQLRAKSAKFAILGNHDYGDYTEWRTSAERNNNKLEIQKAIRGFGFRLLNNDHIVLKKDTSILDIIGVENWGKSEKWRYSNLKKALSGCKPEEIKILLAHDPNEWDAEVKDKTNIVLTLSGHTHAAQLGLKVGHKLFSPAAFVFKHYAGLYSENNQYLYVNRGIGYIGLPMQIGVRPEISLIVLKSKP